MKFEFIKYYEDLTNPAERLNRIIIDVFIIKMFKIDEFCYDQMIFV